MKGTFTEARLQATLRQIRDVLNGLILPGIQNIVLDGADQAANIAATGTIDYLKIAEKQYRGIGTQALGLDEAAMMDEAVVGARASVLRRLSTEPITDEDGKAKAHPAKVGILKRYGMATISHFENILRGDILTRSSVDDTRNRLIASSPFLQQQPAFWAERIARTETIGAYNKANHEAGKVANEQLDDLVRILSATFDNRTGADSIAYHGQIRRMGEPFQSWTGLYDHPPNRPNDREIIINHRISWPIPKQLAWKTDAEVLARWRQEKRKGSPPPRPTMTTIELSQFGRESE